MLFAVAFMARNFANQTAVRHPISGKSITVIASGAKQSIAGTAEPWIASSLSLLAMTAGETQRYPSTGIVITS
jgi:hypothetical protein